MDLYRLLVDPYAVFGFAKFIEPQRGNGFAGVLPCFRRSPRSLFSTPSVPSSNQTPNPRFKEICDAFPAKFIKRVFCSTPIAAGCGDVKTLPWNSLFRS